MIKRIPILFNNLIRKIIYKFKLIFRFSILNRLRSLYYFKSFNITLGENVKLLGLSNNLLIGSDINIYSNCIFELGSKSQLVIGKKVIFSYGCVICINKSLKIGNFVQIGEFTSIRDTSHDYNGTIIMDNLDISDSIVIGNNIWIGRNCFIAPGTIIEDGVVIGANSFVKGHLLKDSIYAGNPIKLIKSRF
jgi:acetyltransferase-like isoleucine patch superfamily enzyme